MNRCLFYIAVFLVLASCRPGTPKQYIQPDEIEDILYDLHVAQGMIYQGDDYKQYDYNRVLYFAAVLKKHGVTQAEFDSSMVYYFKRSDRLEEIYKRVANRLSEEAMNLGATEGEINKYNQFSANGDTANIWTGDASAVLLPYPMRNRIDFNIKADSTYKKGDTFMLNMMLDFYYQSGTKEAEGCLLLVYDNDSVACRTNRLTVAGLNQMRLESDTSHLVKEVKGYIYLARGGEETTTLRLLFIRDLQLIRFHKPEVKKEEEEDKMKTDTVVRGNMMEVESDSIPASADTLSRFGRALPPGGRTMPAQEKTIVPRKDLKLKTN